MQMGLFAWLHRCMHAVTVTDPNGVRPESQGVPMRVPMLLLGQERPTLAARCLQAMRQDDRHRQQAYLDVSTTYWAQTHWMVRY